MHKRRNVTYFEELTVTDAGAKGKSIAKAPDGRVIFLTNAVPGDVVDVQTTKKRKAYFEGKAVKFHRYSEKRVQALCDHFGVCGGCKWQHMTYEYQLFYKQKEVESNLKRLGHLEFPEIMPILGAPTPYYYRNKMEFSFSDNRWLTEEEINSGNPVPHRNGLGFHIPGKWDKILDIDTCHLQEAPSNAIRRAVKAIALQHRMPFFNVRNHSGLLRSLMIRISTTGEIMVVVQFYEDDRKHREVLLRELHRRFPEITSLQYVINPKANDTIYDQEVVCFAGRDHIVEVMDSLQFKINAKSFYQTNSQQAHTLYNVVKAFAGLTGKERVYDLYTGTGTIALFLAEAAGKVVGIESVPEAVIDARANALHNGITNADFFAGDMKMVLNDHFISGNGLPDVVITDPPRDGMHKTVVQQLRNILPEKIVYVSCNSATQARDLALLNNSYNITKVQPVDMFPQTHHVENVVLLKKKPMP